MVKTVIIEPDGNCAQQVIPFHHYRTKNIGGNPSEIAVGI
jgi:hypothetical protein